MTILLLDCDYDTGKDNTALEIKKILRKDVKIFRVCENVFPSTYNKYKGVIINGSKASSLDNLPWILKLLKTIEKIVDSDIPLLGVCFGHQLIARALNGKLGRMEKPEFGYRKVFLTEHGKKEIIMRGIPQEFIVFHSHRDRIEKLPENSVLLAENDYGIQAFKTKNKPIYGIQFHPEINKEHAIRIAIKNGENVEKIRREASLDRGVATKIYRNFEAICENP